LNRGRKSVKGRRKAYHHKKKSPCEGQELTKSAGGEKRTVGRGGQGNNLTGGREAKTSPLETEFVVGGGALQRGGEIGKEKRAKRRNPPPQTGPLF